MKSPPTGVIVGAIALSQVFTPVQGQQVDPAEQAADALLQSLTHLRDFGRLGITSSDEMRRAHVGQPVIEATISDGDLTTTPTLDADALLSDSRKRLFPVYVDASLRAMLTMERGQAEAWRFTSLDVADGQLVAALEKARAAPAAGASTLYSVRVPAMNIGALAIRQRSSTEFIPLHTVAPLGFTAGVPMVFRDAFRRIRAYRIRTLLADEGLPRSQREKLEARQREIARESADPRRSPAKR